jgi:hypothetical protein
MPIYLKQSTASQEIPLGYFVDSTDGDTEETGLTIANTDIKLWKTGATTLTNKNSGGATHISNGIYYTTLDATDTDTLGPMVIFCHVSGALTVRVECVVLAANIYDSLIAASDALQVHANEITAGLITAAAIATGAVDADAIADNAIDAAAIAADAIGSSELAATAVNEIADQVWEETLADHSGTAGSTAETLDASGATAAAIADAVWDEATGDHSSAGTTGKALINAAAALGAGAITFTYTLTSTVDASAIDNAQVWVTTDAGGTNVIASGTTDANGQVVFYLDAGTYYVWRQKSGWNFTNPDTEVVA